MTESCAVPNFDSTQLSVLAILFTDIVLLLIMLTGLLRMRFRGAGSLNLARFLWNQVRWWPFSLTATLSNPPMGISVHRVSSGFLLPQLPRSLQQYVWLFFCIPLLVFYLDHYFTSQVFMILNLNGNLFFISFDLSKADVD